jgi:hypothetical protein
MENNSRQPRDLLKNGQSDSLRHIDDKVRTIVPSQNHSTATLSAEEPFVWTQYL